MHDKYEKIRGNEILVMTCWENNNEGYIIVGGNNPNIQVYSIKTGQLVKQMQAHTDSVTCMIVEQLMLYTGSDDGTIRLWDLTRFVHKALIGQHADDVPIQSIVLLDRSGLLLSCAQGRSEIKVWLTQTSVLVHTINKPLNQGDFMCLEQIRDEYMLLIGTETGNILTHEIENFIDFELDEWPVARDARDKALNEQKDRLAIMQMTNKIVTEDPEDLCEADREWLLNQQRLDQMHRD